MSLYPPDTGKWHCAAPIAEGAEPGNVSADREFRWIKQTLKLRHFYGTNENAERIQIAVALIAILLIKLAHGAQSVVDSLTRFGRLIQATVLHRKRLDRLGRRAAATDPGPVQNNAQGRLLWT